MKFLRVTRQNRTLASIERKHTLQLVRVEATGLRARRVARKDSKNLGRQEEPEGRNAGLTQSAANIGRLVKTFFLHEGLERLTEAVDCVRRFKSEAVGELIVRRGVPGLGLIQ